MTQLIINVGSTPDDGQGTPIRTSFVYCNSNFTELYARAQSTPPTTLIGNPGDVAGMYAYDSQYFYYCFANYNGTNPIWAQVTQVGYLAVSSIQSGTTSMDINGSGGNILIAVAGTPVGAITSNSFSFDGDISSTGNVVASAIISNSATVNGTVNASYFSGDGAGLSNVIGSYGDSNVQVFITNYTGRISAGNIAVSNTITTGSLFATNTIVSFGNITGDYYIGNGALLTGITSSYSNSNVNAYMPYYSGNLFNTENIQFSGVLSGGNIVSTGSFVAAGNIMGNYINGNGSQLIGMYGDSDVADFLPSYSGNLNPTNINVYGNVLANGNIYSPYFNGNGSFLTGLYANANVASYLPTYAGPLEASNITTGNIFSVGTITGNLMSLGGSLTVNTGNLATAIINGAGNTNGDIGQSNNYFNMVYAVATTAVYADIAEKYLADADYPVGTVLSFGGSQEVTISQHDGDSLIVGVVSTSPAYCMNGSLEGEHVATVALLGRVPCLVKGKVNRGDMIISAGNGYARAELNPKIGSVIGKALQSFDGDVGTIEIVVGRL